MVLGSALSALYLGLANLWFFLNIASLPLGAAINDFLLPLVAIDVAFVNLYVMYGRRHVAGKKSRC